MTSPHDDAGVDGRTLAADVVEQIIEQVAHLDEMDHEIAARWDEWSVQLGQAIYPKLAQLQDTLPTITAIMVCTADGLNVCSLGLDEDQVGRLSALATSMFSVASAATEVNRGGRAGGPGTVSLHDGEYDTVLVTIRGLGIGRLLMWVTASGVPLGSLLVRARQTAQEISNLLQDESAAS